MTAKSIDDLIAASSVGAALADVKARGIDAHLADVEATEATEATPPKKKRKKPAPLTRFALAELKKRGWHAQVVEKWIPMTKRKVDLFNVIDIVAIRPASAGQHPREDHRGDGPCGACSVTTAILGIQVTGTSSTTSGGSVGAHRTKILAEPRAEAWVDAGAALEMWTYRKVGNRWKLTIETYAEMREGTT